MEFEKYGMMLGQGKRKSARNSESSKEIWLEKKQKKKNKGKSKVNGFQFEITRNSKFASSN